MELRECELCGRENICTKHHLIPRSQHTNKWFKKNFTKEELHATVMLCKYDCHKTIHGFFSEKDLGKYYNTLEKLKKNAAVAHYLTWIVKQKVNLPE